MLLIDYLMTFLYVGIACLFILVSLRLTDKEG